MSGRAQLLASAQTFCNAFANKAGVDDILSHFSKTHQITVIEHGEPLLAPFLGRPFIGRAGPTSVPTYFSLLQKHLSYEDMSFDEWVVDSEARKVCMTGMAKFTWIEGAGEGQSWDETFLYVLDFDDEGKVTDHQVWADSGAAYLARCGELGGQREEFVASQK